MRRRHSQHRWRLTGRATTLAALAVVVACSGSGSDFFQAPPIAHAGSGGKLGGGSGGSGNSAAEAADAGNDAGGSPDATGGTGAGPGDAGSPSTGGSAGTPSVGGSAGKGGSGAKGGAGGTDASGGAGIGGTAGTGGDVMPGTGGLPVGGAGAGGAGGGGRGGDAGGGLGGTAGLGGTGGKPCEPTEPADEICDGIDNDCHEGVDDGDVCPAGCLGAVFGKHRYLLCHAEGDESYRRSDAKGVCNDHGDELELTLDLARIDSEAENEFVLELIAQSGIDHPIWMGASDSIQVSESGEGAWVWGPQAQQLLFFEDEKPVGDAFVYWGEGQPDDGEDENGPSEDCGVYDPELAWHWNDRLCSNETPTMLCEVLEE